MDLGSMGRFELDLNKPTLFRRCATCPQTPPPCPACDSDEVCSLIAAGCKNCAKTMCVKVGAQPTQGASSGSGGTAAGPIAGGVIGGVAVVCIMTYLVWRFCIKKRRQAYSESDWPETEIMEKSGGDFAMQRDARASIHSVRSIASTVLTRASNVIQIAYIPGVTNRSVESTPDLIPPVPPIPAASPANSTATTPQPGQDQHFFMPSDLRDSTYSDYTVDRTSYARSSLTPSMAKGSVPSTAYRGSAVVNSIPAQTVVCGKAQPVAIKSGGKNSPSATPRTNTPPVPMIDRKRHAPQQDQIQANTNSPIVATRFGVPKAVNVKKAQSHNNIAAAASVTRDPSPVVSEIIEKSLTITARGPSVASSRHNGDSSTFDDVSSSDEESPADASLMGHDKLPQFVKAHSLSSRSKDSPFRSPSSAPNLRHSKSLVSSLSASPDSQARQLSKEEKKIHKRSGSLNQIIKEAARRASREPRHGGLGSVGSMTMMTNWNREHEQKDGPFSDAHAARTP